MKLAFSPDLHTMDVIAQGHELTQYLGLRRYDDKKLLGESTDTSTSLDERHVTTFINPTLVTDNHRIADLGVQSTTLRDTVFALYGSPIRTIEYDGLSLRTNAQEYPSVWGPSIDTLLFCRALRNIDLSRVRSATEIGCGSGFLGAYLLRNAPKLERMAFVDFNPAATEWAAEWIRDPRAEFHNENGIRFLERNTFDMVLCNPPYIPRPASVDDNPYEGVSLLVWLIEHAQDYLTPGGTHLTNISSLCERIAMDAVTGAGAEATLLDRMDVPLKVYNVLNNPEWMTYLGEEKGFVAERRDGYDFWHRISITGVRPMKR